ncbi:hypothetical protein C8Q76DRAFT_739774 [Earliella scabrosa]|nr:hypothetical protein C8Q76DRAFT_739774 [Earliella scabrosa]
MGSFPLPRAYFIALFCEAILHGVYTVLFGAAMYLLLAPRRRRTRRSSTTNIVMTILTIIMYSLATVHISLSLHQNLIAFFDQRAANGGQTVLNDVSSPLVYAQIAVEVVNCLLGDSIVLWRTWVLWGRDKRVVIAPALCIIGGVASGIGLVRAFAISPPGEEVYNEEISKWFGIFGGLTCLANLYAVAAIGYKAWESIKLLRHLNSTVVIHGTRYYGTMLVVIESGLLYSVALIITIILFALDNNGVYVVTDMLGHLTGIYPTGIIVLVCLNMTFHDDVSRAEKMVSTMQCEPQSGGYGPQSSGGSYGTVLHLRKEGASRAGTGMGSGTGTGTGTGTGFTTTTGTTNISMIASTNSGMDDSDYELSVRSPQPWAPPGKWDRDEWYKPNPGTISSGTLDSTTKPGTLV